MTLVEEAQLFLTPESFPQTKVLVKIFLHSFSDSDDPFEDLKPYVIDLLKNCQVESDFVDGTDPLLGQHDDSSPEYLGMAELAVPCDSS